VVSLASGAERFIAASACAGADPADIAPPTDESLRREAYRAVLRARDHSEQTTERLYPSGRKGRRRARHLARLEDRYVLEVLHELGIAPAVLPRIEAEGRRRGWHLGDANGDPVDRGAP